MAAATPATGLLLDTDHADFLQRAGSAEHDRLRRRVSAAESVGRGVAVSAVSLGEQMKGAIAGVNRGDDVLGRYREEETISAFKREPAMFPIDSSATLPDGTQFSGLSGLKNVLLDREPQFKRHLVRQMLGFALGRSLVDRDDCTIDRIAEAIGHDEATIDDLILEVVLSVPFRYRDREGDDRDLAAAAPITP